MAGAISLAAIFFVTVVEMAFSRGQHCCSGNDLHKISEAVETKIQYPKEIQTSEAAKVPRTASERPHYETYGIIGPRRARSNSTSREIQRLANENSKLDQIEESSPVSNPEKSKETDDLIVHKKALLQCLLLELGILFHSIFIGIALSVAIGREFVVLLVAISFHRKFLVPP